MNSIRKDLLFGFVVIFPIAAALWILDFSIKVLTGPISQLFGVQLTGLLGGAISLLFIWFVGRIIRIIIGRSIFSKIESIIIKVPGLRIIYQSIRQIASVIINKKQRFLATVWVEYPSPGIWSLGFLTNDNVGNLKTANGSTVVKNPVAVFIPSTPNPTNGIFVFIEESKIKSSKMSVEDGIKCLMSAGMITPKGE